VLINTRQSGSAMLLVWNQTTNHAKYGSFLYNCF